ncbi:hypothetical protein CerSpe_124690 [Prunus speciosa]
MLLLITLDFLRHKVAIFARMVRNYATRKLDFGKQNNSISRWSEQVPEDIMQSILQRLSISDYVRCKAVCLSWRAFVDMAIATKHCPPSPQLPLIMQCSHPSSMIDHCFVRLRLHPKTTHNKAPPNYIPATYNNMMNRLGYVGSIEGWLIMVDSVLWNPESNNFMKSCSLYLHNRNRGSTFDIIYFFLNPITGARVMLPSSQSSTLLPCGCNNGPSFPIVKVVASASPTSQHCFVASLCSTGHLAFCSPADKSWTLIDEGLNFCDIEIMDGKLYAATDEDEPEVLTVFDIIQDADGHPGYRAQKLVMPIPFMFYNIWRTDDGALHVTDFEDMQLATDSTSKELFMILRRTNYSIMGDEDDEDEEIHLFESTSGSYINPPKTKGFRVFKLEHDIHGGGPPRWVQVFDLGDRILFLSETTNIFMHGYSSCILNNDKSKTLERNCIYFAFDYPCLSSLSAAHDFGVFSMTDGSLTRLRLSNTPPALLHSRPVWFTPSLW